jgi:hypothetical protein
VDVRQFARNLEGILQQFRNVPIIMLPPLLVASENATHSHPQSRRAAALINPCACVYVVTT